MIMNKNLLLYTFAFFLTITSSIIFGGTVSADGQMKIVEKSKEISAEEVYKIKVSGDSFEKEYEVTKEFYDNYKVGDIYPSTEINSEKDTSKVTYEDEFEDKKETKDSNEEEHESYDNQIVILVAGGIAILIATITFILSLQMGR